jgi:hypothetical protein
VAAEIQTPGSRALEHMEQIHYLILAHTLPQQLKRLVDRLNGAGVHFFIHVDAKADIQSFQSMISHQNVFWCERRENCIWGDFSMVKATLHLMKDVEAKAAGTGMCVLISGQDYPMRSEEQIRNFFQANAACIHMDFHPAEQVWKDFRARTHFYKIQHSDKRLDYTLFHRWEPKGYLKLLLKGHIKSLLEEKIWKPRKPPFTFKFYGGSQWWAMPAAMIAKIIAFVHAHEKDLFDFFQDSLIPDEFFFQTIVGYLRDTGQDICLKPPVTYVRWDGNRHPQPVVFSEEDLAELKLLPQHTLFARKFYFPS